MRSKISRVLAFALAVVMAIPASLPAKPVSADTVKNSALQGVKKDSRYSYASIGYDTNYYIRYTSYKTMMVGSQTEWNVAIVEKSGEEYIPVTDLSDVKYEWSNGIIDSDGNHSYEFKVDTASTGASYLYTAEGSRFSNDNVAYLRVNVTMGSESRYANMYVYMEQPYDLKYSLIDQTQKVTLGQPCTFRADTIPYEGITMSYQWQKTVTDNETVTVVNIDGANGATYTIPAVTEEDYKTSYYCVISAKDAKGVQVYQETLDYTVNRETGLILSNTYESFYKILGESITLDLDGISWDAANYQVKYVWSKENDSGDNVPLENITNQHVIPAITDNDFGTYNCRIYAFKVGEDTSDVSKAYVYADKTFEIFEYTGFWSYSGDRYANKQLGSAFTLNAYASNKSIEKYPITYTWAKRNTDGDYVEIAGQTSGVYQFTSLTEDQLGDYRVTVKDKINSAEFTYSVTEDYGWKVNSPDQTTVRRNVGDTVELPVSVESAARYPVTYTWKKNGKIIEGQTGPAYKLTLSTEAAYATYVCEATNGKEGCSKNFYFNVQRNNNFYIEKLTPNYVYKKTGDSSTFQVRAGSDDSAATYSYQWYYRVEGYSKEHTLPNQTKDTLTVSNISRSMFGTYKCVVLNNSTGEKQTAIFYLRMFNRISMDYGTESVFKKDLGEAVTMSANVSNPDNLAISYRWNFTASNEDSSYGTELGAYTSNTLSIDALAHGQYGTYTCNVVYNDNIILQSLKFLVMEPDEKELSAEYASNSSFYLSPGKSVTMAVKATTKEGRTLSYQWRNGSGAILGATQASYTIDAIRNCDYGYYYCVIKDSEGEEVQYHFNLYHEAAQNTNQQTEYSGDVISIAVPYQKEYTLNAVSVEDPQYPTTYQWYYNKDNSSSLLKNMIYDATSATYKIPSVGADQVGYYTCVVENAYGSYSLRYYIYCNTGLKVSAAKVDYEAPMGGSVDMKVSATCKKGFKISYQWYQRKTVNEISTNGYNKVYRYDKIDGATSASYKITATNEDSYGKYYVKVSTEGESYDAYTNLTEPSKFAVKDITASTEATFPGSKIDLKGKIVSPKGAKVEYQWYVKDMITGDYVKAKKANGKDAKEASITVKAPAIRVKEDVVSDDYQYADYKLKITTTIDGVKKTNSMIQSIMVVNPTMKKTLPKSSHTYKAGRISTFGYTASGKASHLKVTFDKKTSISKQGDYMYLIDGNGKSSIYYGTELKGKTVTLAGKKFAAVIVSKNEKAKSYGFAVTKIKKTVVFSLSKSSITLGKKEKFKIKTSNAPKGKKLTYKSNKKKIAVVSKKGVVTGKKTGKAVITVKAGKKKLKLKVQVMKAPKKIKVSNKSLKVARGKKAVMKYSFKPSKAGSETINIINAKSLKKSNITVTKSGNGKLTVKVGKNAKKKTYKVKISTYNKKKASFKVNVK